MLAAVVACSVSSIDDASAPVRSIFKAYSDGDGETKALLNQSQKIEWSEGDGIAIFGNGRKYSLTTSDSGTKASFTSTENIGAGAWTALFPDSKDAYMSSGVIATTIPAEQVAVAGSFASDANIAVAYTTNDELHFRNACAYIKISYKTTDASARIKKITFENLDATALLSGDARIAITTDGGDITDIATTIATGQPYVSVVAPQGEFLAPDTDYYIVAAPAVTGGYKITFTDEDGVTFSKTYTGRNYRGASLRRNTIAPVGRKNLDAYTHPLECYARLVAKADFTEGDYIIAKKISSVYRIYDSAKTSPYISSGGYLLDKFYDPSYSDSNAVGKASIINRLKNDIKRWTVFGAPDFINDYVHYSLHQAYTDSDATGSGVAHMNDQFILGDVDKYALSLAANKSIVLPLNFKNKDTKQPDVAYVTLTNCAVDLDPDSNAWVTGIMSDDSIDELVRVIFIGKGPDFKENVSESDIHDPASFATTVTTTMGFCSTEQVTAGGDSMNDMFMMSNEFLCRAPATPERINIYKKTNRDFTYAEYSALIK